MKQELNRLEQTEKRPVHLLPLLPLRGMVVFPYMTFNFDVGREKSVKALESAMEAEKMIFLSSQVSLEVDDPKFEEIYRVGTIAKINQIMRLPGGVARVVVEGVARGVARELVSQKPFFQAAIEEIPEIYEDNDVLNQAFLRRLGQSYEEYFAANARMTPEHFMPIMAISNLGKLADSIAAAVPLNLDMKQSLLEIFDVYQRVELLIVAIQNEMQVLDIEKRIGERVKERIDQNQKEYYLREQLRVIQEELGDKDGLNAEVAEYREKIQKLRLKKEVREKLLKEVDRFAKMQPSSAESGVVRNYLDSVLELPWNKRSKEQFDIGKAEAVLNRDHYGLEKVKERILEYLAVRKFTGGKDGTILCLVGPPGVGKTSIAKSIAESLGRKYVRISLGGIHDEADIRGHRKTYIGAMEGRIMAAMAQAESKNPLMLLDEVDKMGADYKGDPAAALLEVLDGEQNFSFRDHYIEVPFDLSEVLFITTANTLDTVARPLLDRMEVIELSGYTQEEKFQIAKRYLVPKQLQKNGLDEKKVLVADEALSDVISYYTREAGVRNLERELGRLCRKAAKLILEQNKKSVRITSKNLTDYLGRHRYRFDPMNQNSEIGVARGLAWTAVGGDTLSVEVNVMPGSGKVELTGKLGDVMKESAKTAVSYIRSKAENLDIPPKFYKNSDLHIHVPEGAVPKDGPSAGITMATAAISALSGVPVRNDVAMTGEITLRGRVLPIGGLKEKALAAYRAGITTVIIPEENEPDLEDIPKNVRSKMTFVSAGTMDTVLQTALAEGGKLQ